MLYILFFIGLAREEKYFQLTFPYVFNVVETEEEQIEPIIVFDGHFYKSKTMKRIRFWGSTVGWNFLKADNKTMSLALNYMKSLGINAVRIHPVGIWDFNRGRFNKELMERFDYFVSLLKKNGMYFVLYSFVKVFVGYNKVDGLTGSYSCSKVILDTLLQKKFAMFLDSLFMHRNPYTGVVYSQEPALAFVILTNENSASDLFFEARGRRLLVREMERVTDKKFSVNEALDFAVERDSSFYMRFKKQLRRLGVRCPITFTNYLFSYRLQKFIYKNCDFVCNHNYGYYAHGHKGEIFKNQSEIFWPDGKPKWFPTKMLCIKYLGKPIVIDEWGKGYPNEFRAEAPLIVTAYASLYDYDGLFYFDFFEDYTYLKDIYKEQKFYTSSLEQPFSTIVLFFPSLSFAFRHYLLNTFSDSVVLYIADSIENTEKRRFDPLDGPMDSLYYFKKIVLTFDKKFAGNTFVYSNNVEDIKWNHREGYFALNDKKVFLYAGYIKKEFRNDYLSIVPVDKALDRIYLSIVSLDKKNLIFSRKILITVLKDGIIKGDNVRKVGKGLIYYPSRREYLKKERVPGILLMEHFKLNLSLKNLNPGLRFFYLFPDGQLHEGEAIYRRDDSYKLRLDSQEFRTVYYLLLG